MTDQSAPRRFRRQALRTSCEHAANEPNPPALATAATSPGEVNPPAMGAWTSGYLIPSGFDSAVVFHAMMMSLFLRRTASLVGSDSRRDLPGRPSSSMPDRLRSGGPFDRPAPIDDNLVALRRVDPNADYRAECQALEHVRVNGLPDLDRVRDP